MKPRFLITGLFLWAFTPAAQAVVLPLNEFLTQVRQGNTGFQGAIEGSKGAELRSQEGSMITMPMAFTSLQYVHDGRPPALPLYTYDFQNSGIISLGVSQQTCFGAQAKLSYSLMSLSLDNPNFGLFAALAGAAGASATSGLSSAVSAYTTATTFEISQPLWSNGFGRGVQAQQTLIEAQALASSFGNRFAARASLAEAEGTYWRLVTARQAVQLTQENFDRAQKTYEWSARRAKLQLADRSDELQAQAQLSARRLELQRARDEERSAARALNTSRGSSTEEVNEQLTTLTPQMVQTLTPPKRTELRDDVRAAEQQQRATIAAAQAAEEREKPNLDAFASLSLNGRDASLGSAFSQSTALTHPAASIGLRFQAPLALSIPANTRAGYQKDEQAAALNYQRKFFEQERGWLDLNARFGDAQHRLELAAGLEKVQEAKLFHERDRLQSGRSTAFQVLTFESDFATAQLNRIQTQSEVLGILTQMKLFGEDL
ncbi:TolC family protein [Bdellovibrionota bacterium FG-1]